MTNETVDSLSPAPGTAPTTRPIKVFVNGELFNGNLTEGTNVRVAARKAASENGIVQFAVRVNNQPARLDAALAPGDVLSIEATSTKG